MMCGKRTDSVTMTCGKESVSSLCGARRGQIVSL